ncbi:MAG: helix-turn-helix domain-containing protein [Pyrinomonadaceae bacterium]
MFLTTAETADRLGVSTRRVHQFIEEGRLPAEKKGRDYLINDSDLKLVKNRKPGRPRTATKAQAGRKRSK